MRLERSSVGVCVCVLVLFVVVLAAMALTAVPAFALSEGRVYEMVSPVYKGGYGAKAIEGVAQDGESVAFYSPGAFAGAPSGPEVGADYVSRRSPSGWSTAPLMVPSSLMPYVVGNDVSPTLGTVLVLGKPGANQEGAFQTGTEEEFLLHQTDSLDVPASWELAGPVLRSFPEEPLGLLYVGASPDFCRILVRSGLGSGFLVPEEAGDRSGLCG